MSRGASPLSGKEGGLFITGANPTIGERGGRAQCLQWERATKALNRSGARRPCQERLSESHQVHLTETHPGWGSRGCRAAIDCHIHGVLTWLVRGGSSGGDSSERSCWTFFECGRVVVTAVAEMGGRARATECDWLIVSAPWAGGILTSVSRASLMKRTD